MCLLQQLDILDQAYTYTLHRHFWGPGCIIGMYLLVVQSLSEFYGGLFYAFG